MSEVVSRHHYDAAERKFIFERVQDVEPYLDRNKARQNEPQQSDWGRHVGTIPNVFLEQWLNEEWERGAKHLHLKHPEFKALIWRKLQDPDWLWLRTGKI